MSRVPSPHRNFFAAGISGPVFVRCSTTELQQLSSLVGIEPTSVGFVEVTRAFTTPQTLGSVSFPLYSIASLFLF
jgi:hypothetical protein